MPLRSSTGGLWFWRRPKALRSATHLFLSALAALLSTTALRAQSVQHLSTTQPGGMPGLPVMGGIEQLTNGVQITWDGPSGYYQVYQKSNSLNAPWVALGKATNLVRNAAITKLYSNAFFRVSGPAPKYAGSKVCITCHSSVCRYETNTPHASAFSSADVQGAGRPDQHVVPALPHGGLRLADRVQSDQPRRSFLLLHQSGRRAVRELPRPGGQSRGQRRMIPPCVPRVEIAATVCGGCHTASHSRLHQSRRRLRNGRASGHAAVVPDALQVHEFLHQQHPQLRRLPFRFRPAGVDRRT